MGWVSDKACLGDGETNAWCTPLCGAVVGGAGWWVEQGGCGQGRTGVLPRSRRGREAAIDQLAPRVHPPVLACRHG